MQLIQAIRGFNDILPPDTFYWNFLEAHIRRLAALYGYEEIRLPIVEKTELFIRGVGEVTDIVEKEMYTFEDRNGDRLTLRPEGTAGCVRAVLEHGLIHNQIQRLWYSGPMFRHERPQAGRYREFYQVGFEVFGLADAYADAELILLTANLWRKLGLLDKLSLQLNTLGTPAAREAHRAVLIEYFEAHRAALDEDSLRRLYKNPLRILDSKNPSMAEVIAGAPKLMDFLDADSLKYFELLQTLLNANDVNFTFNPSLVRGLDYYSHGVFEWVSHQLGAQATVCAGGRYDGLVCQLGGKPTPAVGFAMGLDRLILLLRANEKLPPLDQPLVYLLSVGDVAKAEAMKVAEKLRQSLQKPIVNDTSLASFKSQMKRADKSGAKIALIIGEDEVKTGTISVKFLREDRPQQAINQADLLGFLQNM
jgi:histidyl-tRNA synthetase